MIDMIGNGDEALFFIEERFEAGNKLGKQLLIAGGLRTRERAIPGTHLGIRDSLRGFRAPEVGMRTLDEAGGHAFPDLLRRGTGRPGT